MSAPADAIEDGTSRGRWLSPHPDRAEAERFFLLYSPVWIVVVALVQVSGVMQGWGDVAYLILGLAVGLPPILKPILFPGPAASALPWYRRHGVRLNIWIGIFVFIGTYVLTHYFFDVLGMHYRFPVEWTLQARGVGHSTQTVPLFLYPLTQAYFITYHVVMVVALRRLEGVVPTHWSARVRKLALGVAVLALAYVVAFAETAAMANPMLESWFWYEDRGAMLVRGSLFYASYFIVSMPLVRRLDATVPSQRRPVAAITLEALGAGMLVLLLLDAQSWLWSPI